MNNKEKRSARIEEIAPPADKLLQRERNSERSPDG